MTQITAIVPMRHSSERVPGKNYREIADAPLFHHILRTLQAVHLIDSIVVDTDSPVIRKSCEETFPAIRVLDRPTHLRAGEISMNQVLLNTTAQVQADWYLQTHATNPLLQAETIARAIQTLLDASTSHDSLFSVTRLQTRLWDEHGQPVNHDPGILLRTQDLAPVFEENSCIYLFQRDTLLNHGNRLGKRPLMFEIKPEEALDIDEELDFLIAKTLLEKRLAAVD